MWWNYQTESDVMFIYLEYVVLSVHTYVTLDHKTSHKGQIFLIWDLYIIWKLNK